MAKKFKKLKKKKKLFRLPAEARFIGDMLDKDTDYEKALKGKLKGGSKAGRKGRKGEPRYFLM